MGDDRSPGRYRPGEPGNLGTFEGQGTYGGALQIQGQGRMPLADDASVRASRSPTAKVCRRYLSAELPHRLSSLLLPTHTHSTGLLTIDRPVLTFELALLFKPEGLFSQDRNFKGTVPAVRTSWPSAHNSKTPTSESPPSV